VNSKKPYHHGDLRAAFLQAAFDCLETDGVAALSIRSLAIRVGVSKTAPYRHFKDKDELLSHLMTVALSDLADAMELALETLPEQELMSGLAKVYMELARKRPALFRLTFSHMGVAMESQACAQAGGRALSALETGIRRVWKTEPTGGWQHMVLAQWAYIHGLCTLVLEGMINPAVFTALEAELYQSFSKPQNS